MNTPQSNIIDQIADERDDLRVENQKLKHRIELLESVTGHVTRIAKESDDANDRIKRLEDIINRARVAFFADGTDESAAGNMLSILNESKESKP